MPWEVEFTDELGVWLGDLSDDELDALDACVEVLMATGPALGRPLVDTLEGTRRHHHLKELRVPRHDIRVLFAFDLRRTAILLLGGSKTNRWDAWYREMIPRAEDLYDEHLDELRKEGLI